MLWGLLLNLDQSLMMSTSFRRVSGIVIATFFVEQDRMDITLLGIEYLSISHIRRYPGDIRSMIMSALSCKTRVKIEALKSMRYTNPPVNLSSEELSALENNLRFEFGPSVITSERAKELRTMLTLVDKDIEGLSPELTLLETQTAKLVLLLSPMRKLPNETLLHILQDVCDENLLQCYPWRMNENPPTMTSPIITYLPTTVISSFVDKSRSEDLHYVLS
ncbi:hypothetical protein BDP27DRAFT_1366814 [Rhodocollybia butyracea]|uniref:Uncharacterized protein n=1 Tax=Rhodocollybia butyracea TaxID=206335 RepID=A0A9P5PGH6_9AGAR|nr:hypothetical protein BDP27DRAFT_1366814 [Rhodocollybia butyracea]